MRRCRARRGGRRADAGGVAERNRQEGAVAEADDFDGSGDRPSRWSMQSSPTLARGPLDSTSRPTVRTTRPQSGSGIRAPDDVEIAAEREAVSHRAAYSARRTAGVSPSSSARASSWNCASIAASTKPNGDSTRQPPRLTRGIGDDRDVRRLPTVPRRAPPDARESSGFRRIVACRCVAEALERDARERDEQLVVGGDLAVHDAARHGERELHQLPLGLAASASARSEASSSSVSPRRRSIASPRGFPASTPARSPWA